MNNYDLSILIPARNEEFLKNTVKDILKNKRGNTEIIVGLDGYFPNPPIDDHEDVTIFYSPVSIGQRAMTNQLARLSKAKYVAKCDAHLAFDEGFDEKLMKVIEDDWTIVPTMRNLHAFDWVCEKCGDRRYQGPTPTNCNNEQCDSKEFKKDVLWKAKESPRSTSYRFDTTLHFQYFGEFKKRLEGQGNLTETLSLQGSFFMLTREKYWELNICDEGHGSWGQQGVEVALKTWLSGGKVMVNQKTWYAHMFRTQGGDFSFPYHLSGRDVAHARKYSKDLWFNNRFEKQIYPLSWLIEKFKPVPGWHDEKNKEMLDFINKQGEEFYNNRKEKHVENKDKASQPKKPTKGIIFYTHNQLNVKIAKAVQRELLKTELPIVSVSDKPMPKFGKNIHLPLYMGKLPMFIKILTALHHSDTDYVFFCEHDVLYHKSHFDFTPPTDDKFYYNENFYKVDLGSGKALHYDAKQVSGICVNRKLAIKHYTKRLEEIEKRGFSMKMGYEPGTHGREERVDDVGSDSWKSERPNIDIRHEGNLSPTRWSKEEFRNKKNIKNWHETTIDKLLEWSSLLIALK